MISSDVLDTDLITIVTTERFKNTEHGVVKTTEKTVDGKLIKFDTEILPTYNRMNECSDDSPVVIFHDKKHDLLLSFPKDI